MKKKMQKDDSTPAPPAVLAGLAGLLCLPMVFFGSRIFVRNTHFYWLELLLLIGVPMVAAFSVLYRSSWHHEFSRFKRISSLILLSGLIYCVDILAIVVLTVVAVVLLGLIRAAGGN